MIKNEELLKEYEEILESNRNELGTIPWWKFNKRYNTRKEIKKYESLCLMTWMLSMMDKIETKHEI